MALSIKDPETDRLAREVARLTNESLTQAIANSLRDRLKKLSRRGTGLRLAQELNAIALECAALPVLDVRSADEILDYDERGLPGSDDGH